MNTASRSTRRDERHRLRRGSSFLELAGPAQTPRTLTRLSSVGLAFETEGELPVPGERLPGVVVRVGECRVSGDAVVRSVAAVDGTRSEVGCLFYPASCDLLERWLALIAGLESADTDGPV